MQIKSYPRVVETTIRTEKNKRKEKRAALRERKDKVNITAVFQ